MNKPSIYNVKKRLNRIETHNRIDHIIAEITQSGAIKINATRTGKPLSIKEVRRAFTQEDTFVLFLDFEEIPEGESVESKEWHKKTDKDYQEWLELINKLREEYKNNENFTSVS